MGISATAMRSIGSIGGAEQELVDKVWYNRHQIRKQKISDHTMWLVEEDTKLPNTTLKHIWEGALRAAAKTEETYGLENLGPYSDFEWGMLNGKLSALRWVMGEDWDALDT